MQNDLLNATDKRNAVLGAALDGIAAGLSIWTSDFKLIHWNRPFVSIYNLNPAEVQQGISLEKIARQIVGADPHPDRSAAELYRLYRERLATDTEHSTVSTDGKLSSKRIITVKRTELPGIGWVILHEDVTKSRKRDRAASEYAVRLEAAVAHMTEGLCMFDSDRRLVISNRAYAEIYGLPEELVAPGTDHANIVAYRLAHGTEPFDPDNDFQKRYEVLIKQLKPVSEIVQLGNGRIIRIAHQSLPIGGWVATHLDITEQKVRERQLTLHNIQMDAAINNTPQGLCMFDQDKRLIVSNRLYATMYHIAPEELHPGMSLEEIVALRLARGNEPKAGADGYLQRRIDLVVNNRDDGDIVELMDGRVIAIMHHPMQGGGWVSTHQDITAQIDQERRESEAAERTGQQQKLEALGTLAGGIAHDLNNTLVPVLGLSKLILEDMPESDPNRRQMQAVVSASERARALVRQILDFSRVGAGSLETIDLTEEVRRVSKLIRAGLPATAVLTFDIDAPELRVRFESTKLYQILMNICVNSFDALPAGKGIIVVSLRRDEAMNRAVLAIRDDGAGMDKATLARCLEPFFTTKDVGKGTGLGLSIIHGIVTSAGGEVEIGSDPGQGTTVTIWLPIIQAGAEGASDTGGGNPVSIP
jgi:signal transduction histidine kinase